MKPHNRKPNFFPDPLSSNKIIPLEREKWQDYRVEFHYTANNYYDVEVNRPFVTGLGFQHPIKRLSSIR